VRGGNSEGEDEGEGNGGCMVDVGLRITSFGYAGLVHDGFPVDIEGVEAAEGSVEALHVGGGQLDVGCGRCGSHCCGGLL
jgi:hypothetical protein